MLYPWLYLSTLNLPYLVHMHYEQTTMCGVPTRLLHTTSRSLLRTRGWRAIREVAKMSRATSSRSEGEMPKRVERRASAIGPRTRNWSGVVLAVATADASADENAPHKPRALLEAEQDGHATTADMIESILVVHSGHDNSNTSSFVPLQLSHFILLNL